MTLSHMLVAGPVEVAFTVGVFAFLTRTSPELFTIELGVSAPLRSFYGVIAALVIAALLGLLATGTARGEWGGEEMLKRIGYLPTVSPSSATAGSA
jgi:cobalt/nickel transport system permease protein